MKRDSLFKGLIKLFGRCNYLATIGCFRAARSARTGSGVRFYYKKNFLQFVDRLRSQVERQVQDPVVQAELIKEMAQRNANETCRRIILSFSLDPSPSLAQMIEACTRRAELFSAPERNPGLTHPKPVAAAAPGARRSTDWTVITVDLQNISQDMKVNHMEPNSEYFVIGDTAHTPLEIEEDKVQRMPPWKYLGLQITARTIVLQKLEIECNPKTLADLHSLCGSLNWAKLSHQQYHQNVPGLIRQFQLTWSQARATVATYPNFQVQAMPLMGQAVVERAHQTLKQVLARQSSTTVWMSPHEKLCKAMFTIVMVSKMKQVTGLHVGIEMSELQTCCSTYGDLGPYQWHSYQFYV
ncbi:hypothetical protein DUI87_03452 [Hirundo rustica rustica]|uniref:Uncharacterized protein n=1 Tax=Hirundo rustica rustica TaxID=333673 RepID=A0A3M0L459_HIRRU|nr:hypothetical protein DUI87_03452 [Hirundo rustica rustica]